MHPAKGRGSLEMSCPLLMLLTWSALAGSDEPRPERLHCRIDATGGAGSNSGTGAARCVPFFGRRASSRSHNLLDFSATSIMYRSI